VYDAPPPWPASDCGRFAYPALFWPVAGIATCRAVCVSRYAPSVLEGAGTKRSPFIRRFLQRMLEVDLSPSWYYTPLLRQACHAFPQ